MVFLLLLLLLVMYFSLSVSGPFVCCFKPPSCQRERVLWKPSVPCGGLQPPLGPEHGGDVLLPPPRLCRQASPWGWAGLGWLLQGTLGEPQGSSGRDPVSISPVIRGCIRPCRVQCTGWGAGGVGCFLPTSHTHTSDPSPCHCGDTGLGLGLRVCPPRDWGGASLGSLAEPRHCLWLQHSVLPRLFVWSSWLQARGLFLPMS